MTTWIYFLVITMVLFSGCIGEDKEGDAIEPSPNGAGAWTTDGDGTKGNDTIDLEATGSNLQPNVALSGLLQLDGCTWMIASSQYAPGTNPAPTPPGWGPEDKPMSINVLELYECSFISLDGLDRPASLLMETTDSGARPEACEDSDRNVGYVVNLFTDDEALAKILSTRYHAPAKIATFDRVEDESGITWTWAQGGEESSLHYPIPNLDNQEVPLSAASYLWETPNGTNSFEIRYDVVGSGGSIGAGTLASHHFLGMEGHFAGITGAGPELSLFAKIRTRGPLCEDIAS